MKSNFTKLAFFAAAALLILVGMAPTAHAGMVLRLNDGISPVVIVNDNGVGDASATVGQITWLGSLGTWTVNVTTGISKPVLAPAQMDLNSVNVSSSGAGVLTIELTDTDFNQESSKMHLTNAWGGTTVGTVTAQGYLDPNNQEFGLGGFTTGPQGPFGPGAFADTATTNLQGWPGGVFSLTEIVTITHTANGPTSFDKHLVVTLPEPGSLILFGTGLLGLSGYSLYRRRRKK
jgi:hypothetical protein